MFYPLGKNSEKPYGGRVASTPSPPSARPRVKIITDLYINLGIITVAG